jgi:hypothetical protein
LVGCDEGITEPPPIPPPRYTPAEVVELIEEALCYRDIDELAGYLANNLTFYFDDNDVGKQVGEYTIPESWTSDDFLNAVSRIFNDAHSIDISITSRNVGKPNADDTTYIAENVYIQFLVMVDVVGGYLAHGFVTFESDSVNHDATSEVAMRNGAIVILAVGALLAFTACDDGGTPPPPPPYDIIEIIECIEDSFLARDTEDLKHRIHSDFTFYFDPEDVGEEIGGYIIPRSWVRDEFIGAAGNMFDMAYSIDIKIDTSVIDDPLTDDNTYTAADVPIDFLVMTDEVNGYMAQGTCTFELRGEYNQNSEKHWCVTAWRDFTSPGISGSRGITPSSFGRILIRFHKH